MNESQQLLIYGGSIFIVITAILPIFILLFFFSCNQDDIKNEPIGKGIIPEVKDKNFLQKTEKFIQFYFEKQFWIDVSDKKIWDIKLLLEKKKDYSDTALLLKNIIERIIESKYLDTPDVYTLHSLMEDLIEKG